MTGPLLLETRTMGTASEVNYKSDAERYQNN